MHSALIESSDRLQRMLNALRGGSKTTFQLQAETNDMAPATTISELRQNGFEIHCLYRGKSNGRKVYSYFLI